MTACSEYVRRSGFKRLAVSFLIWMKDNRYSLDSQYFIYSEHEVAIGMKTIPMTVDNR
jgi:hypothetical protein